MWPHELCHQTAIIVTVMVIKGLPSGVIWHDMDMIG